MVSRWIALIVAVILAGTRTESLAQVREVSSGQFTVVPYGGTDHFFDPTRYSIYCASSHLLEIGDPFQTYPPWRHAANFRSTMEVWRTRPTLPVGRTASDFVIYLEAGTNFHVLGEAAHNERQNPHYKIRVDSGPHSGQTCWTNYE